METLEPRLLLAGIDPTVYAQYMLELINRGRANPAAEAVRLGIGLNEGLVGNPISAAAKQPLAFNPLLIQAAQGHTQWMLTNNLFTHIETPGNTTPMQRMQAAGYKFTPPAGAAENIGWIGVTAPAQPDIIASTTTLYQQFFTDTSVADRGHRLNLMDPNLQEAGISLLLGPFQGSNSLVCTQDFAFQSQSPFITGVVYDDRLVLRDNFYTPGEGLANVTVTAVAHGASGKTYTTTTFASGGYSLEVPAGTYDVQFSGGSLSGVLVSSNVAVTDQNVKVDLLVANPSAQANLVILPAKSSTTTVYSLPGGTVSFGVSVRNSGTAKATGDFNVTTFLSDTKPPTATDEQVDTYVIHGLNAGATNTQTRTFTAPTDEGTYYFASLLDTGAATPSAGSFGSVYTLIVGRPDLAPTFTKISLPDIIVPGDKGSVSIGIANSGTIPGTAGDIEIFASQDGTQHEPAPGDVVLSTIPAGIVVGPNASKTITAKVNITDEMSVGSWFILVDVDPSATVPESNEANNIFVTPTPRNLVWQFGTFADRKNVKLMVHDSQDTLVTFALSGGGWGEVQGGSAFSTVVLNNTTAKSFMTATTSGPTSAFGDLTVLGSVKSISAAKINITGNVDISGGISTLKLGDVVSGSTITLHSDPLVALDPKTQAAVTLGFVSNCDLEANDEPIKSLSVIEWQGASGAGNAINATSLGSLTTRGQKANVKKGLAYSAGNFNPTITLSGAVNKAKVTGSLSGQWTALSVKSLSTNADVTGFTLDLTQPVDTKLKALGSLTAKGWIRQSRILSDGNIGTITAGGTWDCDIFAAVSGNPPPAGLPDPASDFFAQAAINTVTIKGTVNDGSGHSTINTNIAAYTLGSISLRNALATNAPPAPWGLAGHTLAKYAYKEPGVNYTWKPSTGGVPSEPSGDFTVLLV